MSYLDKFIGQGGRRSVYDILSLDHNDNNQWENVIKPNYVAKDIDKVVIGGNNFTNYGDFQFAWEKSYVKSPERSADGSIGNLNSYATFVTPHLIINFSLMSIDDYRKIMRLDLESNEFVVECYDPIYNKKFKGKMYFATQQMAKLFKLAKIRFDGDAWEEFIELVGVQEYTVELIGTNADIDLVSVQYKVNAPEGETAKVTDGAEDDVYNGEEVLIGTNTNITTEKFNGRYKFKDWNDKADGSGQSYTNGYVYTINQNLVLYAQWEATTNYTMSYNYGVAFDEAEKDQATYPASKKVVKGLSVGKLPPAPEVVVYFEDYPNSPQYPYYNGAWYRSPVKAENSVPLADNFEYDKDRDSSIYLLYDIRKYELVFKIERGEENPHPYERFYEYQANKNIYGNAIEYGSSITFPNPVREGYKFDGWYSSDDFRKDTKKNLTSMPAANYTLYGRWIKE